MYLPQQSQKPAARKAEVHSTLSIAMRVYTSRSQFNASKPAALCAVGDPAYFGDTFDAARMDDMAAMTTRQEKSTKKRLGRVSGISGHATDIASAETHGR